MYNSGCGLIFIAIMAWTILSAVYSYVKQTPTNVVIGYALVIFVAIPLLLQLIKEAIRGLQNIISGKRSNYTINRPIPLARQETAYDDTVPNSIDAKFNRLKQIAQELQQVVPEAEADALYREGRALAEELSSRVTEVRRNGGK